MSAYVYLGKLIGYNMLAYMLKREITQKALIYMLVSTYGYTQELSMDIVYEAVAYVKQYTRKPYKQKIEIELVDI